MELQCAVKCFKDRGWTVEGQDSVRRLLAAGETTQAPPAMQRSKRGGDGCLFQIKRPSEDDPCLSMLHIFRSSS